MACGSINRSIGVLDDHCFSFQAFGGGPGGGGPLYCFVSSDRISVSVFLSCDRLSSRNPTYWTKQLMPWYITIRSLRASLEAPYKMRSLGSAPQPEAPAGVMWQLLRLQRVTNHEL